MMTGKYTQFLPKLKETFDKHFLKSDTDIKKFKIHYFIFTDGQIDKNEDITVIPQDKLGWPNDR